MPLDTTARRYADTIFAEEADKLARAHDTSVRAATASQAARGSGVPGARLQIDVQHMEAVANARAETLLTAYAKARVLIDDQAVAMISAEVDQVCEARRGSIAESMSLLGTRTGMPSGWGAAISGELVMEASRIKAQVHRKLLAKRDEAILETRNAPTAAKSNEAVAESKDLDSLLALFTKREFTKDLPLLTSKAGTAAPLSALFIDLDHFKSVNDTHGHPIGDEVLIGTTSALKTACEGKGHCYRWGGEELVVLLPNYNSAEAVALAERIREAISQVQFSGYPNQVTASIGVASYPEISASADELEKDADQAMYAAKDAGRNRVCLARKAGSSEESVESPAAPRTASPTQATAATSIPSSEIQRRVDAVEISARITQGIAQTFMLLLENESAEELTISQVRLESREGHSLTNPYRLAPDKNRALAPHGQGGENRLDLSWQAMPDPAAELAKVYGIPNQTFPADIVIRTLCQVLGSTKWCKCTLRVQVDPRIRLITQF
jgi:diguanylate cyclase (GGDEF)-like protein